jgi:sulfide dehydrogenase [flavocytochrome c] flavoprotein subunit
MALSADTAMTGQRPSRRHFIAAALAGASASLLPRPLVAQGAQPRIVVVGGGFAGATAARFLKRADARLDVTLVEPNAIYSACPMSNEVIAGLRDMRRQMFGYEEIRMHGRPAPRPCCCGANSKPWRMAAPS